jgi:hypothetical protein
MGIGSCVTRHEIRRSCAFKRRSVLRKLVIWSLLFIPIAGFSASGDEFYQRLFERGMTHFAAGEYASAFTELRNAAFGFVEQVENFETAQSYAAIAAHRIDHDTDARDSLRRIVGAEKVQPHFGAVKLPDAQRAELYRIAAALLTSQECTILGVPAGIQDAAKAANPPVVVPTPTRRPNVAVTAPHDGNDTDTSLTNDELKPLPGKQTAPASQSVVAPAPQPAAPVPQPVVPAPQPVVPAPQPVDPQPETPTPRAPQPVPQPAPPPKQETIRPQPQPAVVVPVPVPVPAPQAAAKNADSSLAEAQRAIDNGDVGHARTIYNALLNGAPLPHAASLRLAEGLYRVRDFAGATRAFQHAGTIGRGEEGYHYYYAVALYESGRYAEAKRELTASLPFIAVTTDVARYRAKIEGAIE